MSIALFTPSLAFAAKSNKVCVTANGTIVVKRKCNTNRGETTLDVTSLQAISFAEGQVGPEGPKGETGAQGPQGATGASGPQGPAGPQGLAGPQGPAGTPGAQGPQGPMGVQGIPGPKGDTGNTGMQGPVGPQGPAGILGLTAVFASQVTSTSPGQTASVTASCTGGRIAVSGSCRSANSNLAITAGYASTIGSIGTSWTCNFRDISVLGGASTITATTYCAFNN